MRRFLLFVTFVFAAVGLSACNPLESKQKAGLQVITHAESSSLFLNGQYLDKTPYINKEIKPGEYTLRIQPDNPELVAHETSVSLRKGVLTVVTWKPAALAELSGGVVYEMQPLATKKSAELAFVTVPDNAIIKLDNREEKLFSPTVVTDIEPGEHEFEVTLPSYETQRHKINVVQGYKITATIKLAKNSVGGLTPPSASPPATTSDNLPEASSSPVSTSAARRAPVTGPSVTIKSTRFFIDGKEVLRVRDSAGNGGKELGQAEVGAVYAYLGETTNGWHKIDFNNQAGWVSGQYTELKP
jgi:hypothetical protein